MLTRAVKKGRKFQNPEPTSIGGLRLALKVLPQMLTGKEERVPRRQLGPFRTASTLYVEAPASGLRVTWMGHSSMLIEIDGLRVLVDPVWDQRASPVRWFGPKRFFEAPLPLEEMPALDAILISHDHFDHLGKSTIQRLARSEAARNAQWTTSLGVGKLLRRFGVDRDRISELDWTESTVVHGARNTAELTIAALPARHFSGRALWNRFETLWSSFALQGPRHSIYFGADSGVWDGFAEIGAQYGPFDLTMLDTGAYNELWKHVHMGPDGAAEAFSALGNTGLLMPIHWGLFNLALHAWRQPIERITELADRNGIRLWSPAPGVPTEVIRNQEHRSDWWKSEP